MTTRADEVLKAVERVIEGLGPNERRRVLEASIAIYERDGLADVTEALRGLLAKEPLPVVSLAATRVTRDAPETVAEFTAFVSMEDSPGCANPDCRAFVLGVEVGILTARLDAQPQEWHGTYHAANAEILGRVAKANGYVAAFDRSADALWVFGVFTPKPVMPRLAIVREDDREE